MSNEPMPAHQRTRLLAEADTLFEGAHERERAAGLTNAFFRECTEEASQMFYLAAVKYRDLGLGLRARESWRRAATCHRSLAAEQERIACMCEAMLRQVPVVWERPEEHDS